LQSYLHFEYGKKIVYSFEVVSKCLHYKRDFQVCRGVSALALEALLDSSAALATLQNHVIATLVPGHGTLGERIQHARWVCVLK